MKLKVGFSRVDITPPVGTELSGFGPFLHRHSTSVRSRIYARAMAVDDGSSRWVIASCELLGLDHDLVKQAVLQVTERTGWSSSEISLHATHNHSGPQTAGVMIGWGEPDPLYLLRLPDRIANACVNAIQGLTPALVHHAEVPVSGFSHNRMLPNPGRSNAAALRWEIEPSRPDLVDTTAHVFRVDDDSGQMKGFFVYFSCHPVVCCESTTAIHADYPGEALKEIEAENSDAIGVFLQGALGDIDPNYTHGPAEESYDALTLFGHRFAECVQRGLREAAALGDIKLGSSRCEIDYSFRPYSLDELVKQRNDSLRRAINGHLDSPTLDSVCRAIEGDIDWPSLESGLDGVYAISLNRIIAGIERGEDIRRPVFAQSLAFGPFVFTGMSLEIFHGTKRRHQRNFGPRYLLLSCTNGYSGYAPTEAAFHTALTSYPAFVVPTIIAQLPFRDDIEATILAAAQKTVLKATGRR